jgi:hypothetical protein
MKEICPILLTKHHNYESEKNVNGKELRIKNYQLVKLQIKRMDGWKRNDVCEKEYFAAMQLCYSDR